MVPPPRVHSAVSNGALLGAANAAVIGIAIACTSIGATERFAVFAVVTALGLCPAMIAGVVLGRLAAALDGRPAVRFAVLAIPAVATVIGLGLVVDMRDLILPAVLPTLAATSILERTTRAPATIPVARAS